MKLLPLVVEGIENKIKKLHYTNQELKQEKAELLESIRIKDEKIAGLSKRFQQLENDFNTLKVAKSIAGQDQLQARQKINEMLREIQKCYSLLNR
ncbi:MAG: hypothetical protein ACOC2E_07205 [Bacteroidota bacterium]